MAIMKVNPTRMELSNLKKKLVTARRGHKLLKDKRDELMRQFLVLIKETKELRLKVETALKKANSAMNLARIVMDDEAVETSLLMSCQKLSVEIKEKNIMSVIVPEFEVNGASAQKEEIFSYGYAFSSGELDEAVKALNNVLPDMLLLAEKEKQCQLLSSEIEKTRRRVNALENVLIPQYEETIKYITMKLEENERSATTRLMKMKDLMLNNAHGYTV
ncbi:MAG: V-type ATP synthase subunit D [Clostridia bacterium]|nr:V-type ATP synthase subunit D [Clostridia bacterium]